MLTRPCTLIERRGESHISGGVYSPSGASTNTWSQNAINVLRGRAGRLHIHMNRSGKNEDTPVAVPEGKWNLAVVVGV